MFVMTLSYLYIQIIFELYGEKIYIFLEAVHWITDILEFGPKYFLFLLIWLL